MPSDGIPYPIFVYTGLLFWQFFSSALGDTSNCLISNQAIITKVYFPRLILPLSSVLTKLVDFGISALVLILLMFYYGFVPRLESIFVIPIVLIISFMASVGLGTCASRYQCEIPRCPIRIAVFYPNASFCNPSYLSGKHCRKIFLVACAQSYDWSNTKRPRFPSWHSASKLDTDWNFFYCVRCITNNRNLRVQKVERYFADII